MNKKNILLMIAAVCCIMFYGTEGFSAAGGDIQITCEPGIRIWVNDVFKGTSRVDENGLFVENLPPGTAVIKASKTGFQLETRTIEVIRGRTIEVRFNFTRPVMHSEDLKPDTSIAPRGSGTLILRSVPLYATIFLNGNDMGKTDRKISEVPAGSHLIRFEFQGNELEQRYNISPNQTLQLKANFRQNQIIEEFDTVYTNTYNMKFVYIRSGVLTNPLSGVQENIEAFFMQTTEVTQQEWEQIMGKPTSVFTRDYRRCNQCPAANISWDEAKEFAKKLSQLEGAVYRLPTTSEWAYACQSGHNGKFGFGDDERQLPRYAWYQNNSRKRTHPVGRKESSPWGLYDMHGNVSEWCQDTYGKEPICKGGDYSDSANLLDCFVQKVMSKDTKRPSIGFRLVKVP